MSFKLAQLQVEAGMPLENIRDSVEKAYKAEDKETFDKTMREEYEALFPEFREMTYQEYLVSELDEELVSEDVFASEFRVDTRVKIDYSEDETHITFEEYINETRVVTEAIEASYDDTGLADIEAVAEVTELVRPYVANDVTDKVDAHLKSSYRELRAKEYPPIVDYVDAVVKGDVEAQKAYIDACLAIKEKYPKHESN